MPRRRVLTISLIVVAAALIGLGLFRPSGTSHSGRVGPDPGQLAPLFSTTDLDGHPVGLADYRGRRVVINFWASWCVPCRTEFPVLKGLLAAHPDVVVLGVVFQDAELPARDFLRSERASWPGLRDPSGQIASGYHVFPKPGIPVSVLIDVGGRVRTRHLGPLTSRASAESFLRS